MTLLSLSRLSPVASLAALLLVAGCVTGCSQHPAPSETDLFNQQAALPTSLPVPVLENRVITSSIDRQQHTMSTLTGNDIAVTSARAGTPSAYPEGAVLTLATWNQRDDPHWFGARIPATPRTVETVTITRGANGQLLPTYHLFAGNPLQLVAAPDPAQAATRQADILAERASVMP
ncbi:MAG TPA: hypothetical protein VH250_01490 [Granulicella sp.]|jgi:hypothetical protein|nr:hypothetical protein [Granulicella sp.]